LSTRAGDPLISICVPTHHGRRDTLGALLQGISEQAQDLGELVEICVSDNASRDGTAELLAELPPKCACRVSYHRQPTDIGLARNLTAVVGLARGRYCWILGSDDLLSAGALKRACEILQELPGATGYAVGAVHVDAEDPSLRSRALPRAFHPPGERTRLIEGVDGIYEQCGNSWCALSWSLVDRLAWLSAARANAELMLAHPFLPHVVPLAAMAAERPTWGWLAEPLVRQRNATTFLFEHGEVSLAERWTEIIGGAAAVWGAVIGRRGGRRWRRRMRRLQEVWGSAADARATKLYERPSLRSQARLARTCLAAYWPVRGYWSELLPATLMPVWMTRARYGLDARGWPGRRDFEAARLRISGELPRRIPAGSVVEVKLEVRNEGARAILPDGARSVAIAQRWSTAEGRPLGREELALNELAFLPQPLARSLRARRASAVQLALYAPVRPGVYRVEVLAHQHGVGWLDQPGASQMLAADLEVLEW
jgi:glycosyltransferase involved in cell wall biosynthesis